MEDNPEDGAANWLFEDVPESGMAWMDGDLKEVVAAIYHSDPDIKSAAAAQKRLAKMVRDQAAVQRINEQVKKEPKEWAGDVPL